MDAMEYLTKNHPISLGLLESEDVAIHFFHLFESYHQAKSKEFVKSPLRDIISDVMDEFAEAVMVGGSVNVSEFVDKLHNQLLAKSKISDERIEELCKAEHSNSCSKTDKLLQMGFKLGFKAAIKELNK